MFSGDEGELMYSIFGKEEKAIGKSSGRALNKLKLTELYPGWQGSNLLVCCDFTGLLRCRLVSN